MKGKKGKSAATSFEWIPVAEKLPDGDERVLVWRGTNQTSMCAEIQWYTKRGPFDSGFFSDGEMDTNVTHWGPLPLPPKADRAKEKP